MGKWAKNWLNEQRMQGTKCLEIKQIGKNHYVYQLGGQSKTITNRGIVDGMYGSY